jgi:hypothetical protein
VRIPDFTASGILPVGTYSVTFEELRESILVSDSALDVEDAWDGPWRKRLVDNAAVLVGQLRQVGITEIFLDGSFVEAKPNPNDIDGYFECDPVELARGNIQRQLNAIDPFKVWTWDPRSRRPAAGSTKRQLPMWHHYRVELYPHHPGLLCGICDSFGNELQFPAAFRQQRGTWLQKGIVKIIG